ncbi:MAG: 3-deoxy-7-phosphoheptulonate synthase [Candidatus Diapherotrites archaeon]|uniref:3-deoxy-7-phosphoheptulonate synthase n=1 Tax=Candidatus Iainarchaeum sp. TaxID=3101447 RepID=A0A938YTR8_9ARCH|nr:3-deoxy-7-phosphoheptulonate synthase [Candidatus Diapherotrites archaeon]
MPGFKLVGREARQKGTVVKVGNTEFGSNKVAIIAGPCAIESEEQLLETALAVKEAGAAVLRGSAYKPRSSPYSFQGLEEEGLKIMAKVKKKTGLLVETEVIDARDVALVSKYVDALRIGARNMQNFSLLREVGKSQKPVILKNGISSTLDEFLCSAEYILAGGNKNVILCNRGIRTTEPELRFPVLSGSTALLKQKTHLPVIVDPSHSTGNSSLIVAASRAAIAEGADGLIIEVHPSPEKALSDKRQQLTPGQFKSLMPELERVAKAVGRGL